MRTFFGIVAFSLLIIGFFAGFSNLGIPQINPAPPPVEEKVDLGAMTMDQFIALGEKIVTGKGTCMLCHNAVGGRAPLLDGVAKVAGDRLKDPRYKGTASDLAGYIRESMAVPSAFVVAGFGKAGSGDSESPMPDVTKGSIGLAAFEVEAVVAYLQTLGGSEVTVSIPAGAENQAQATQEKSARKPLGTAEEVIAQFGCGACHKVAGEAGEVGPDLTQVGKRGSKEFIRRSILEPDAEIAKGFEAGAMPLDFGDQIYAKELEMLVDYLAKLK